MLSEAVKLLKGEYCVRAIRELKMDRAIIFCRTKVDCDKLEMFLESIGTGFNQVPLISFILDRISLIAQTKKNSRVFVCMGTGVPRSAEITWNASNRRR